MTEIEKLVETYLRTDMTAETFMRKARPLRRTDVPASGHTTKATPRAQSTDRSGPAPATEESTPAPTGSGTETTPTAAMVAAEGTTSPCETAEPVEGATNCEGPS